MEQVGASHVTTRRERQRRPIGAGALHMKATGHRSRVTRVLEPADLESLPEAMQIDSRNLDVAAVPDRLACGVNGSRRAFGDGGAQKFGSRKPSPTGEERPGELAGR